MKPKLKFKPVHPLPPTQNTSVWHAPSPIGTFKVHKYAGRGRYRTILYKEKGRGPFRIGGSFDCFADAAIAAEDYLDEHAPPMWKLGQVAEENPSAAELKGRIVPWEYQGASPGGLILAEAETPDGRYRLVGTTSAATIRRRGPTSFETHYNVFYTSREGHKKRLGGIRRFDWYAALDLADAHAREHQPTVWVLAQGLRLGPAKENPMATKKRKDVYWPPQRTMLHPAYFVPQALENADPVKRWIALERLAAPGSGAAEGERRNALAAMQRLEDRHGKSALMAKVAAAKRAEERPRWGPSPGRDPWAGFHRRSTRTPYPPDPGAAPGSGYHFRAVDASTGYDPDMFEGFVYDYEVANWHSGQRKAVITPESVQEAIQSLLENAYRGRRVDPVVIQVWMAGTEDPMHAWGREAKAQEKAEKEARARMTPEQLKAHVLDNDILAVALDPEIQTFRGDGSPGTFTLLGRQMRTALQAWSLEDLQLLEKVLLYSEESHPRPLHRSLVLLVVLKVRKSRKHQEVQRLWREMSPANQRSLTDLSYAELLGVLQRLGVGGGASSKRAHKRRGPQPGKTSKKTEARARKERARATGRTAPPPPPPPATGAGRVDNTYDLGAGAWVYKVYNSKGELVAEMADLSAAWELARTLKNPSVRKVRANPAPGDIYDPRQEQLRVQKQAIYESNISRSAVEGEVLPFRDPEMGGLRLDAIIIYGAGVEAVRPLITRYMWRMGMGVQGRTGWRMPGTTIPAPKAIKAAKERYAGTYVGRDKKKRTVDDLLRNRQSYEETLGISRKSGFYRVTQEPTAAGLKYFVWPMPHGERTPRAYTSLRAAEQRAGFLNQTASPIRDAEWWVPPARKYTKRELDHWLAPPEVFSPSYDLEKGYDPAIPGSKRRRA